MSKNQLRIIGGEWKRRLLPFASIDGLRPTPDRLRETLFNWLMWDVTNSRILDVCAGSGALAFEALSRGAKHATLIEPQPDQVKYLKQNAQTLGLKNIEIFPSTAQQALAKLNTPYDVIFLDPPYALNLWEALAQQIQPLVHDKSLIYVEADRDLQHIGLPSNWVQVKNTKVGVIRAGLYKISSE